MAAPVDDPEQVLLDQVYTNGGETLYCQEAFAPGDRVKVDAIYDQKGLLRHFGCITFRQCLGKPGFPAVGTDLHNLYPVSRASDLVRRSSVFGDLPEDVPANECGVRTSYGTLDPSDRARGNVARAMLYMHTEHKLPLIGPLEMYQRWSHMDPPDQEERTRNDLIDRIQNRRNPYIDQPDLVDQLTGLQRR